jgi:hypothetical protein
MFFYPNPFSPVPVFFAFFFFVDADDDNDVDGDIDSSSLTGESLSSHYSSRRRRVPLSSSQRS